MADFVAVIRRAVDGLSNNTPEMRVKVYEKARGAVRRQLENMTPRPPEEMLRRQLEKLEAAIVDVESEYAEALPPLDEPAYAPEREAEPYQPPQPDHAEVHDPEPYRPEPHQEPEAYHEPEPHQPEPPAYDHEPEPYHEPPAPVAEPVYHEEPHHHEEPVRWEEATPEPVAHHDAPQQPVEPEPHPAFTPVHDEPPGWGAPLTPPAAAAETARRNSTDAWLDEHLDEVAAHAPRPAQAVSHEAASRPVSIPQATPPAFDEASALNDFDAFVRENAGNRREPPQHTPDDLLHWEKADQQVSFGEVSGEDARKADDPAWISDFTPPPVAEAPAPAPKKTKTTRKPTHSPEEMAAVLAKSGKKTSRSKSRGIMPYVIILVLVLLAAGGGYAAWMNRASLDAMLASFTNRSSSGNSTTTPASTPASTGQQQPANAAAGDGNPRKFTQRLTPDGKEVDEGASTATPATGEGRSVSQQNVAAPAGTPAQAPAQGAAAGTPFVVPENGQKAYLYEERLGQTTPTTIQGYILWSEVKETGDNGRAEPVIQGKLTIPDRSLTALITFKRNTDSSLPASHLLEVVFSTGDKFDGGSIDSVQRVTMKRNEQDRGDPIVAVPAKITDDTFMIAFNDFAEVVARNVDLLRSRDWIDIPVTYRNGRRALITLDKGATGKPIFENVIKEWVALGGTQNGG
ncbi:hypothetical protein [Rhizobium paknamense]|uniref:Transcriptional regulator n=1 Tax=Rhizobium paknamense TaxID=1206817 RepID=A0ABU0II58_9HYPH|nr:hypothetical protein [Rhizobium paknamense]MDQ0457100.1 hypothetical protein [Rhizobium paknamense]